MANATACQKKQGFQVTRAPRNGVAMAIEHKTCRAAQFHPESLMRSSVKWLRIVENAFRLACQQPEDRK